MIFVAWAIVAASCVTSTSSHADAATPCTIDGSRARAGIFVRGQCYAAHDKAATPPPTEVIFCGRPSSAANALWNQRCGPPRMCIATNAKTGKQTELDAFATLTLVNGRWADPVVWCPANAWPALDLAGLRDRAERLLPGVGIGSAWTTVALVNAETVLWAGTGPDRSLPTVTILGRAVQLRIHFDRADWDFGDGSTDTTADPGKPYDSHGDPCRTAQCLDYYGHTYAQTGVMTITLTVTWHAQYRLGATWTDIAGTITGPTGRRVLTVKQARGILVPNPGETG
jgi:hypothetical protein